jgi:hypothetical protein
MKDKRNLKLICKLKLLTEDFTLDLTGRMIVIVVKADLPYRLDLILVTMRDHIAYELICVNAFI